MLYHFAYFVCYTSIALQTKISWRLIKQGKELSFINLLLAIHFLVNAITTSFYLHFFFKIGSAQLFLDHDEKENTSSACKYYITSWLGLYITGGLPSLGIVFCRFIYVRYSHGLLADKGRLFHKIVLLVIFVFTLHGLLIWPLLYQDDYKSIIKGKICNKLQFSELSKVEFHVKPKLLSCMGVVLYMMACIFFQTSARRQRVKYGIPKRRCNLITIDQHALYLHLIGVCLMGDQLIINICIQVFHSALGVEDVFKIWWMWHLTIFVLIHIIAPYLIISIANKEYPEFEGLKGRTFPGQEKPRPQPISPMRETGFYQDNTFHLMKKYKFKRHKESKMKKLNFPVLPRIVEENIDLVVIDIH